MTGIKFSVFQTLNALFHVLGGDAGGGPGHLGRTHDSAKPTDENAIGTPGSSNKAGAGPLTRGR